MSPTYPATTPDPHNPRNRYPGRWTDCLACRMGKHEDCASAGLHPLNFCQCKRENHA